MRVQSAPLCNPGRSTPTAVTTRIHSTSNRARPAEPGQPSPADRARPIEPGQSSPANRARPIEPGQSNPANRARPIEPGQSSPAKTGDTPAASPATAIAASQSALEDRRKGPYVWQRSWRCQPKRPFGWQRWALRERMHPPGRRRPAQPACRRGRPSPEPPRSLPAKTPLRTAVKGHSAGSDRGGATEAAIRLAAIRLARSGCNSDRMRRWRPARKAYRPRPDADAAADAAATGRTGRTGRTRCDPPDPMRPAGPAAIRRDRPRSAVS